MVVLKNVTGFSSASGVAQKGQGKPYQIGRLFRLVPIKDWKNDHGSSESVGFKADERDALDIDLGRPALVAKLKQIRFDPVVDLEIDVEPHPEDPLRNVIVDVKQVTPKAN
jgi:hypothetical protein